jgi:ABC-2 type transport system ATP-binding protein
VLELKGLVRRFGETVALDGLTFTVPRGTLFGFLGPNGAGKTTAMRAILGITAPEAGTVSWNGNEIGREERRRFGYMPEERGLYPGMLVGDQLVYLGRLHGMTKAAAKAATEHWLERLGVVGRMGDKLESLSLGNQQRVQLASALLHSPELLVLDEPFSGLDPVGVDALASALSAEVGRGVTVLFSSHQLDLVEDICESVAIVNRGKVVASGTVTSLASAGRPRLVVEVAGDRSGAWAQGLDGVEVTENDGGTLRLLLDDAVDPQSVLAAAQRAGAVQRFSVERRRLSEVFREAVTGSAVGAGDGAGDGAVGR